MALDKSRGLLVYTDGAYSKDGPGGWAWVAVDGFGNYETGSGSEPPPTTNNRMEMTAVHMALDMLSEAYGPCEIEVVSDSAYVVLGCQNPDRKRNANKDIWSDIEESKKKHDWIQWRLIRGHVGIKWNELADSLAVTEKKSCRWKESEAQV